MFSNNKTYIFKGMCQTPPRFPKLSSHFVFTLFSMANTGTNQPQLHVIVKISSF